MMRTWQTRLQVSPEISAVLASYARLFGQAERCLFADLAAGKKPLNALKQEYLPRFGITARQFNAIRIGLEGKIRSIQERRPDLIKQLSQRITQARKTISKLRALEKGAPEQRAARLNKIHQKNRRLALLEHKRKSLQDDEKAGKVRLCFGSRQLFHAQFHLEENGYADHQAWLADWKAYRSDQFMLVGSKDETAGNQSCQLRITDGSALLKLRLPNAMGGTRIEPRIELPVVLPQGKDSVTDALTLNRALSYRFFRDKKGWRLFISTDLVERKRASCRQVGTVGVDINADHLAIAELDRNGNIVDHQRILLCTYGKSKAQALALIGDAVKQVIDRARQSGKPIALEDLDFAKKKAELEGTSRRYARMLSGFAYSRIVQTIQARAFDAGIEVLGVNPACTSVIGRHKFARRYGMSTHQAAAACIGRRANRLSELPNRRMGDQVTFALPVRNRAKHVWSFWRQVSRQEAAHAARLRLAARQSRQAGRSPDLGSIRDLPAQSRHASPQHCSVDAIDTSLDVPF